MARAAHLPELRLWRAGVVVGAHARTQRISLNMRAILLVVVAHAAALAVLCAGETEIPNFSEARECSVAEAELAELRAENIALRKVNAGNIALLRSGEFRAESVKPLVWRLAAGRDHLDNDSPLPQVPAPRRKILATPAPTPFTPIPTPFTATPTTATPSATPSVSPVPTTEGVTTHSQLAAAVADTDNSVVIVEADVTFPSFSAITVDAGRSVSVVGRSAVGGGRVVFDGAGHSQHFYVTGGTLHLAFIDLVNGTASQTDADCTPDVFWKCRAGSILVNQGGTLVMRSCDIRGRGRDIRAAYRAGGVGLYDDKTSAEFYNVSFTDLCATYGAALHAGESTDKELATSVKFFGSQFLRNSAISAGVCYICWYFILSEFSDCHFADNDGIALLTWGNGVVQIVRCVFSRNTGTDSSWPGIGPAVLINTYGDEAGSISDSIFEHNTGIGSSGGALTVTGTKYALINNVSFLYNTASNVDGGAAIAVEAGSTVEAINCFALGNVATGRVAGFRVAGASIVNCER